MDLKESKEALVSPKQTRRCSMDFLILFIQAEQVSVALILVTLTAFIPDLINPFLLNIYWIGLAAGTVYLINLLIIIELKDGLKGSLSCYILEFVVTLCEAIILAYIGLIFDPMYMFYELAILCSSFYLTSFYALLMKKNYSSEVGRLIAIVGILICFVPIVINKARKEIMFIVSDI